MATEADINLALGPFAGRLADGAPQALASLWRDELATADPAALPGIVGGRLASPVYKGFAAPPPPPPAPAEDPTLAHAREWRRRQILGTPYAAGQRFDAGEVEAVTNAEAARKAAEPPPPPPPWYRPGMTPTEAAGAEARHAAGNDGSFGLVHRPFGGDPASKPRGIPTWDRYGRPVIK